METKKQVGGGQVKEKGREEILRMKENFFVSPVSSMSSKLNLDIFSSSR